MKLELCYSASNANQVPTVVDWGKNNLICYGSCNAVKIYNPNYGSGGKVTHILIKHTKRVNCIKWLGENEAYYETELISGSADSTVCIWKKVKDEYEPVVLEGHSSNVNIVDGIRRKDNSTLVLSLSMDHTAMIWHRPQLSDPFVLTQTLHFGFNLGICAKLTSFPNSEELLLLCALDDSKVHVFKEIQSEVPQFEIATALVGHEDWIRGLDLTSDGDDLLLATCSQDAFIRLWRITLKSLGTLTIKKTKLTTASNTYNIYLESVISGHENWIYSVKWNSNCKQLLSASIDKSMIIWEYDDTSELWLEKIRVGEIGGNTLGFYGGLFGPKGDMVLGHSYNGAFHIWKHCTELLKWVPSVSVGGHFDGVLDCSWEPKGQFLFTTSADQTTRILAPWKQKNKEITWHEIARPQVHGYGINSIAVISRYYFASGAEEKVIRIFKAPVNFVENLKRICNIIEDEEGDRISKPEQIGPQGASVPSLGLSNKAIYSQDNLEAAIALDKKNIYPEESKFTATELEEPPTEETLLQNTLWPETQKLYGHGYEVYSLAASPDGRYLASSCKSTKPEHSSLLLWDTSNWKLIQKLVSHALTVVQLQFSPNSNHLLSVSRDRRWSLFSKNQNGLFDLIATTDKAAPIHSRIIWTCCWSHDSKYFATGSRDGKIAVWSLIGDEEQTDIIEKCKLAFDPFVIKNNSVTALAFAPDFIYEKYLMAVGLEDGGLEFLEWCPRGWHKLSFSNRLLHHSTIKRLVFRPIFGEAGKNDDDNKNVLQLASCSLDCSVNVLNIFINK